MECGVGNARSAFPTPHSIRRAPQARASERDGNETGSQAKPGKISYLRTIRWRNIITHAWLVMQEARLRRVWFQLAAQVTYESTQAGTFASRIWAPHALQQFPVCQDLTGIASKLAKQIVLGWRQVNILAAGMHTAVGIIHGQAVVSTTAVDRALYVAAHRAAAQAFYFIGPSQGHPYTGQQFVHAERLGQVIICPLVKSLDLHWLFVMRRKRNYRRSAPFAQAS